MYERLEKHRVESRRQMTLSLAEVMVVKDDTVQRSHMSRDVAKLQKMKEDIEGSKMHIIRLKHELDILYARSHHLQKQSEEKKKKKNQKKIGAIGLEIKFSSGDLFQRQNELFRKQKVFREFKKRFHPHILANSMKRPVLLSIEDLPLKSNPLKKSIYRMGFKSTSSMILLRIEWNNNNGIGHLISAFNIKTRIYYPTDIQQLFETPCGKEHVLKSWIRTHLMIKNESIFIINSKNT